MSYRLTPFRFLAFLLPLLLFLSADALFRLLDDSADTTSHFSLTLSDDVDISPEDVERAYVTGFFADWRSDDPAFALQKIGGNRWTTSAILPPGKVQYKFVVYLRDGSHQWVSDPHNEDQVSDSHGGHNSVLHIPDWQFYQLLFEIVTLGLSVFVATYMMLMWLLSRLVQLKMKLVSKLIAGVMIIILVSNGFMFVYQLHENRQLVKQGVIDSVHMLHLHLFSQNQTPQSSLNDPSLLQDALNTYLWPAKTRVESEQSSLMQITLSDVAILSRDFVPLALQNRQQNAELQVLRSEKAGFQNLEDYMLRGLFGAAIETMREQRGYPAAVVAGPGDGIQTIETTETRWARRVLGFSAMLVPVLDQGKISAYYAVNIQTKLYGAILWRVALVNLLILAMVLLISHRLLCVIGQRTTTHLERLTSWVQRINHGDLESSVTIRTQDEIQTLAEQFAAMQKSLKRSFARIEQQNTDLNRAAYSDLATDLPNRSKLAVDIHGLAHGQLVVIALEDFQRLHNFLGEQYATALLRQMIQRIKRVCEARKNVQLYRIAPDLLALTTDKATEFEKRALLQRLQVELNSHAYEVQHTRLSIATVAAVVSWEDGSWALERLLEKADVALQRARTNSHGFQIYDHSMDLVASQQRNLQTVEQLQQAIAKEHLQVYYQPIVFTDSQALASAECLLRILDGDNVLLTPDSFLPVAKSSGLYPTLTQFVLTHALHTLNRYPQARLSFNLSPADIEHAITRQHIIDTLSQNSHLSDRLVVEITETETINQYEQVREFAQAVKSLGCKLALDDFGSGFSNFTHLLQLPVDYVKIDGTLIRDLDTDPNAYNITRAIAECARSMDIKTVAEYVHSKAVFEKVTALGIDYCQGYYFGAPNRYCPFDEAEAVPANANQRS